MIVILDTSALRRTRWYEYATRFVLGGLISAAAAIIGKKFGASIGGLFLAFPAILPASATLIEKREKESKQKKGLNGIRRAREAAGADAAGATMGGLGLIAFATCAWRLLPGHSCAVTMIAATVIWATVSLLVWTAWKRNLWSRLRHAVAHGLGSTATGR